MARDTDDAAVHHDVAAAEETEKPSKTKRTTRRGPRRPTKRKPAAEAEAAPPEAEAAMQAEEAPAAEAAADSTNGEAPRKRTRRGRRGGAKRRRKATGVAEAAPGANGELAAPPPASTRFAAPRPVAAPSPVQLPLTSWPPAPSSYQPAPPRPYPRGNEPFGAGLVEDEQRYAPPRESFAAPQPATNFRPPSHPPRQPERFERDRRNDEAEPGNERGRRRSRRRGGRGRRRGGRDRREGFDNGQRAFEDVQGGGVPRYDAQRPGLSPADYAPSDEAPTAFPAPLPDEELAAPTFLDEAGADIIPLNDDEARAESGEASATHRSDERPRRLVMKPRPARHARGGRRRHRSDEEDEMRSGRTQAEDDEVIEVTPDDEAPTDAEGEIEVIPLDDDAPKRPRRGRRGKKKTKTDAAEAVADDEADLEPAADVPIPSIDMSSGRYQAVKGAREMIMNVTRGAECRVGILQDGRLEELYIERQSAVSHVGNIYMGKITNVEPSIQAAFIDFGMPKNGFLHISDVQPRYFPGGQNMDPEPVGKKVPRRDRPPIQKCFRRGDKVIVQVVKEGVGTKGPTLTTYLSIPGRFVVMMPGMNRLGVSRKIEDDTARRAMRDLLGQLTLPDNMGFILRTAGLDRNRRELQNDLNYLQRLWKTVEERIRTHNAPCELYQESDLVIRTIRDVYASDFARIVVDDPQTADKARTFLRVAMPRTAGQIVEYRRPEPIFHYFGIEEEIRRLHSRHVPLQSGGSIVIDTTEAMVTIDVNSGKFRELQDAEETAFRINLEAAEEIARQLRLRDLGGIVVCDFIDLRLDRHKRSVEKALRDALKKHKERARILRMSKFGIIEMTRQRQRPSIKRSIFVDCPHCTGTGHIKTAESMSLEIIRALQLLANRSDIARLTVSLAPSVAGMVLNDRRAFLYELEQRTQKVVSIVPEPSFPHDRVTYDAIDYRGMPVRVET